MDIIKHEKTICDINAEQLCSENIGENVEKCIVLIEMYFSQVSGKLEDNVIENYFYPSMLSPQKDAEAHFKKIILFLQSIMFVLRSEE